MTTGTCIDRRPSPVQFAVQTSIESNTIANWMGEMIKAFREYTESVENRMIFAGLTGKRVTPRGMTSVQSRTAPPVAKSSSPRFLTISREAKSLQVTMLSTFYTEILIGIVYLHHRAFELEDLVIGTGKLKSWMEHNSSILRETALSVAVRDCVRTPGIVGPPSGMSRGQDPSGTTPVSFPICRPPPQNSSKEGDWPPPSNGPVTAVKRGGTLMNRVILDRTDRMIRRWYRTYRLYVLRHPLEAGELQRYVVDMDPECFSRSFDRVQIRLEDIGNRLTAIQTQSGRSVHITVSCPEDVILFKQEDFSYPFDSSWFELAYQRSQMRMGHERLEAIVSDVSDHGGHSPIAHMFSTISERVGRDIRDNLLTAIAGVDGRMKQEIIVKSEFIDSVSAIIADYIIDQSFQFFNYAVGYTDQASGTTIQLRALKIMYLLNSSNFLLPLTEKQTNFLSDVMTRAIMTGKS